MGINIGFLVAVVVGSFVGTLVALYIKDRMKGRQ